MHYEVEVGGRVRQVTLTRSGGTFAATIDGHSYHVDAVRVDDHTLSLVVDTVSRSFEVTVTPNGDVGQLTVTVGGVPLAVGVNTRRRWRRQSDGAASGSGPQRITAPMPGKIVRVLVSSGDAVHAHQPLIVVEAMKMENELRAGRGGTVAELHVREGQSVEAGALLTVIQ